MRWSNAVEFFPFLLQGAWITIQISLLALLLSMPLGLLLASGKLSKHRAISQPTSWVINVVRGVPMIVLLFYIYFVFPDIGISLGSFQAAVIGLGFAYSTYVAEIFRSGILSVDSGQLEAARSIGMGKFQAFRRVVLPQAFKVALPPLSSTVVMLIKDSAIASTIAVTEMTRQGQLLAASTFDNSTVYTMVACFYLAMTLPLMQLTKYMEARFGKHQGN
ncbi:amino acid ABC transporter permease [Pandoraea communis]|uniref:Amino acid ABC transporter permease n=1 Tax=Pandoraea communis TaxID=2508297 RepID=A0A5E4YJC4_9BURK|nr:amino acid ABC transporter permease [Pandoraea communis]MDM8356697.1 amino acid ABC transporter permease [Pandoraea communis]VVE48485.1 amino acid ABC transporter permease [Pandoraea communis]